MTFFDRKNKPKRKYVFMRNKIIGSLYSRKNNKAPENYVKNERLF